MAGSPPRDFARWPPAARMGASAVGSQVALAADHAPSKWYRATGLPSSRTCPGGSAVIDEMRRAQLETANSVMSVTAALTAGL
jgi:hypothetical protein